MSHSFFSGGEFIPIFFRRKAVLFAEYTVKIALVTVARGLGNIAHRKLCAFKEPCRLAEALFLQKLRVGFACTYLYLTGEPIEVIVEKVGKLREAAAAIVFLDVAENGEERCVLRSFIGEGVGVVDKLDK